MKLQSTIHVVMDSIVLEPSSSTACHDEGGVGGRAIDRHNPIIRDEKRLGQGRIFHSSSATADEAHLCYQKPEVGLGCSDEKRKSVAFSHDGEITMASDFTSPTSSSRCLLSDIAMSSFSSEFRQLSSSSLPRPLPPPPPPPPPPREHLTLPSGKALKKKDALPSSPPPPTPQPPPSPLALSCDGLKPPQSPLHEPPPPVCPPPTSNQVVVLEVALHCRGCERKMKKHISKMEGVTSFKIEFAAKKVTVVGDVTPLAVLTSVLKVKNTKLLTPASISSSSSSSQID
ncbi:hypothetical protein R6Q57_010514 [Mikania cordata]